MTRLLLALATLAAFASTATAQQDRLRVVTTTGDLKVLAKAVGAERVTVTSLVPPGERPERYAPRLQETSVLKGARVVVRAGPGIDGWFDKLLSRAAQKNGATGIERGEKGHIDASAAVAATDPTLVSAGFAARNRRSQRGAATLHYWLDPKTADAITAAMVKTFSEVDPDNKRYYEQNRAAFLSRLNQKLSEWTSRLEPLKGEPLLAFHDDWDYFARRFNLNIVDFITERDGAPPKLGRIGELAKLMKDKNIRIILAEANQPERHSNMLAQRTGAKVVQLAGSVGMLPNTDDYISLFDANVNALVSAYKQK
ncbi:metal ABC transporter substrate-binding protein [Pseudorhodoplanes sp.]|uniref:metal ABC transporter substrate-binding protein n=1 Tax=Pseudorhodoplanes sp. TaxID=1934341 RepID=UPI002C17AF06|nr:metal ABC transporter substrate-binding protein [Pseudorhodoplanes sp.]HWV54924.1 metal ABC transporter substrate-binding protein [Pseudorhodoplanes sp.]